MKPKIKFSVSGIKDFFVNNGEKMVLAIMAIVLLMFLYGAITAKPLDESKSAATIVRESGDAQKRINEVDYKDSGETVDSIDLKSLNAASGKEVQAGKLVFSREWNPGLFPDLTKRPVPEFFPVQDLQAAAGYAIVPYTQGNAAGNTTAAPAGGAKISPTAAVAGVRAPGAETRPMYYVILTGLVPAEKEIEEYRRRFERAMKPDLNQPGGANDDIPHYYFFKVQRAEVKDASDKDIKWTDIPWQAQLPDGGQAVGNHWAMPYPEIVQASYVLPVEQNNNLNLYITWPLPPVFLKYWGLEAGHPKVPFIKPLATTEVATPKTEGETPTSPLDIFNPAGAGGAGMSGTHAGVAAAAQPDLGSSAVPAPTNRLFRFIDTTVEKGKTYRYQVQLLLLNPNFQVKPEILENPASAKSRLSPTPWSESSAAVTVPRESRILADGLLVARGGSDPQGKIHLLTVLKDDKSNDWLEVAKDFEVPMGGFVWFKDVKIENVPDMAADEVRTITVPSINADLSMLLDVRNDDALGGGKSKGPTEMLFIDNTGKLSVSDSAVDSLVLKDYQQRTTVTAEAPPAAGH